MKPSIPQGTRDFAADVVRKRRYILQTIQSVFELYGFEPLETPAMENLETLMGKYGEEGDKLIFKILNNGLDNVTKHDTARADFEKILAGKWSKSITERALRYDLTIPFARYVAMNQAHIAFPFKRYQMQPVWRADRPQRGRYREFYQCDADIAGSASLINEIEFASIYHEVFKKLGLNNYELRINSRKILTALAETCGGADEMMNITIAIDKLDKIGLDGVVKELSERGLTEDQITIIKNYLSITGDNTSKFAAIESLFGENAWGKKGLEELRFITNHFKDADEKPNLILDFTLARGLNYYTGIIFEAKAPANVKIGSIGGGGRYDDLTGLFGVPHIAGAGISFGVDRLYDVLEELQLFPKAIAQGTQVLIFHPDDGNLAPHYGLLKKLRAAGIAAEMYPDKAKSDKQFKYAEKKSIPYVVRAVSGQSINVKNIQTGVQKDIAPNAIDKAALNF